MDGSPLVFIIMPIVIPICLFVGIALPLNADSYTRRRQHPAVPPDEPRHEIQEAPSAQASPPSGGEDSVLKNRQTGADDDGAAQLRERSMGRTGG